MISPFIFQNVIRAYLAPILPHWDDPGVTEIIVHGTRIQYEANGKLSVSEHQFPTLRSVLRAAKAIAQYVGRRLGPDHPRLDARLPDGSRVCIVLPPLSNPVVGPEINIRKFSPAHMSGDYLLATGAADPEMIDYLVGAVRQRRNILVCGGTSCGKTTLVNWLARHIHPGHRVVLIEDTRELQIGLDNVVQLEYRAPDADGRGEVTIRDLFVTSLRLRPDHIIVGEVRRGEALDLIQALNSGHRGAMATLHADTPRQALTRLVALAHMADSHVPSEVIDRQVASGVDVVVQLTRHDGQRYISEIAEVQEDGVISTIHERKETA